MSDSTVMLVAYGITRTDDAVEFMHLPVWVIVGSIPTSVRSLAGTQHWQESEEHWSCSFRNVVPHTVLTVLFCHINHPFQAEACCPKVKVSELAWHTRIPKCISVERVLKFHAQFQFFSKTFLQFFLLDNGLYFDINHISHLTSAVMRLNTNEVRHVICMLHHT